MTGAQPGDGAAVPGRRTWRGGATTGLWLLVAVVVAVQVVRVRSFWYYGMDIEATWYGARNLWEHGDPYRTDAGHSPFVYPPSAALLFSPAALLPNRLFIVAGQALVVASAVLLAAALARQVGARTFGRTAAALSVVTLLSSVGTETLGYANLTWVVAALGGWTLVLAGDGRWRTAGVLVGLAVAIKPMAAPLALVMLLGGQWAALAVAAGVPLLLNAATIPLLAAPTDFFTVVLPRVLRGATTGVDSNPSLWAVGQRHDLPEWLVTSARGLLVVGAVALVARAARRHDAVGRAVVGLGSTAALMLVVQVNQPSYGLVLLPLAAAIFAAGGAVVRAVVAVSVALVLACGTPGWVPTTWTTLGVLALLACSGWTVVATTDAPDRRPLPARTATPAA